MLESETDTQKSLIDLQRRITALEEKFQQEKPQGEFALQIGSQTFEPNTIKVGAGSGIRYFFFQLHNDSGYDQVVDDLTTRIAQETTYIENGETVFKGRTVEIWQDLRDADFWWAKVEVEAFT
ncbi:MAG: hypothetical protein JST89_08065 [Cyanobacteria bacterium SZAS-4]|nr:hypothetical protein [Cyanobacteria bacterium SZAS-4]